MTRKRILLVDDSSTALLLQQMILQSRIDFELIIARDGQEALEKALAELPDVIVMDVVMPRMTGIEACQQLRLQERTRNIPIIIVTTRGEPEQVELGYASGCNDYVTKPVNGVELLSKLDDLMSTVEEPTR
jgi:CheY-like chemotaxis protein